MSVRTPVWVSTYVDGVRCRGVLDATSGTFGLVGVGSVLEETSPRWRIKETMKNFKEEQVLEAQGNCLEAARSTATQGRSTANVHRLWEESGFGAVDHLGRPRDPVGYFWALSIVVVDRRGRPPDPVGVSKFCLLVPVDHSGRPRNGSGPVLISCSYLVLVFV